MRHVGGPATIGEVDDDWDGAPRRPAWVRWVALIAAAALLLPLVVAAVDMLL